MPTQMEDSLNMFVDLTKTIKALEMYFPTSWGVPAHLEEKYDGKEAAKKWRENKLKEELSKWLEWAKEQKEFVDALNRTKDIKC